MCRYHCNLRTIAPIALLALPAAAAATSIAAAPPHDPVKACAAIRQLVGNLNAGDLLEGVPFPGPTVYTDELGRVDPDEDDAFLASMRNSDGKPDREPIRLAQVFQVQRGKHDAIYLVVLVRIAWHEARATVDELTMAEDEIPAGYDVDRSHWLASFHSNFLESFREADEMYRLARKSRELKSCPEKRWP